LAVTASRLLRRPGVALALQERGAPSSAAVAEDSSHSDGRAQRRIDILMSIAEDVEASAGARVAACRAAADLAGDVRQGAAAESRAPAAHSPARLIVFGPRTSDGDGDN
jgi:hypothetical protein